MKIFAYVISFFVFSLVPISNSDNLYDIELDINEGGNKSFARFLSHFEKVDLPEEINHAKILELKSNYKGAQKRHFSVNSVVRNDMKDYIIERKQYILSRMGPPDIFPLSRFYTDENTLAVTYLVRHHYDFAGFNIGMALFDLKGNKKLIFTEPKSELELELAKGGSKKSKTKKTNSMMIAGINMHNTTLCSFENPQSFSVKNYKNNWKKEVSEFGIVNNTITSFEKLNSEVITILPKGGVAIKKVQPSYASME